MRIDHFKHIAVGFMLTVIFLLPSHWFGWWLYVAPAMALAIGVYKEHIDRATTGFDWTDVVADCIGIIAAVLLFLISWL